MKVVGAVLGLKPQERVPEPSPPGEGRNNWWDPQPGLLGQAELTPTSGIKP